MVAILSGCEFEHLIVLGKNENLLKTLWTVLKDLLFRCRVAVQQSTFTDMLACQDDDTVPAERQ